MYESFEALEVIKNYSICVLIEGEKIRNFHYHDDIDKQLVYINNCITIEGEILQIKKGEMCRAIKINVSPNFNINRL